MKSMRRRCAVATLLLVFLTAGSAHGQVAPVPNPGQAQPPESQAQPAEPADPADPAEPAPPAEASEPAESAEPAGEPGLTAGIPPRVRRRELVRIGQDVAIAAGETVREAVVIFGDARVAGEVERDMVVVMGTLTLLETAVVGGSLVAVGGDVTIAPGARVDGDAVIVGGVMHAPDDFRPGREHVVIGTPMLGATVAAVTPWVNRGLLWGRPLVPDLRWMWGMVAVLFVLYAFLTLLFERPIRITAATIDDKPLTAFGIGALILALAGPVVMLLTITVIGIAIVPFLMLGLFAVAVIGRVATVRWIGMRLVPEEEEGNRLAALRSVTIGVALLCLVYIVPVIGMLVWLIVGILGIGAGSLALVAAYRKENPPPPPAEPVPAPVPPFVPPGAGTSGMAAPGASPGIALTAEGVPVVTSPPPVTTPGVTAPPDAAPPPTTTQPPGITPPPLPAAPLNLLPYPRAGFGERIAAGVLDVILVAIVVGLLRGQGNVFLLLLLVYLIGFWAWKGTTIGGIICQLRVIRVDGRPLEFLEALVRGLSSLFSLAVLGLGFLWILRDADRQAWHDKIAGTFVVKVPRHVPLQ